MTQEWRLWRHCGLLSADLYILVYDVSSKDSFTFLRNLRDSFTRHLKSASSRENAKKWLLRLC